MRCTLLTELFTLAGGFKEFLNDDRLPEASENRRQTTQRLKGCGNPLDANKHKSGRCGVLWGRFFGLTMIMMNHTINILPILLSKRPNLLIPLGYKTVSNTASY